MTLASVSNNMRSEIVDIISGGMVQPRMVIVGIGGAGSNTISRMKEQLKGIPRIAINTDMEAIKDIDADRKICVGTTITFGEDTRGFAEVARHSAELAEEDIRSCLLSKDVAFIVAGFGGGTGTGIAPYVAKLAKGLGLVTFGIGILPFKAESSRREHAEEEIYRLKEVTDSTIVLDNETLLKFGDDISLNQAFHIMDQMVVSIVRDVSETLSRSFISALADEIISYQQEFGAAEMDQFSHTGFPEPGIGIVADNGLPPQVSPLPQDQNLVDNGGIFQRT